MKKNIKTIIVVLIGLIMIAVAGFIIFKDRFAANQETGLDEFAKCLKDKGALFYGASWCSHCQAQKKMFGSSVQYIPYIECSPSSGQAQSQVCTDAGIEVYPTWIFADGSRESAALSLEKLADKTSCQLPVLK